MKSGDYFRWSYKVLPPTFEPYWCKSRIAVVVGGVLIDTYWQIGLPKFAGCNDTAWTVAKAAEVLNLVFVANVNDLVKANPGFVEDHLPEDIVDLTHPNGGTFYLRKGAVRNMDVQRVTWTRKRDEAQDEVDMYQRLLDLNPVEV